jgi:hypothetical protein
MFNEYVAQELKIFLRNLIKNTKKDKHNWIFYEGKYFFAKNKKDVEDLQKLLEK